MRLSSNQPVRLTPPAATVTVPPATVAVASPSVGGHHLGIPILLRVQGHCLSCSEDGAADDHQ